MGRLCSSTLAQAVSFTPGFSPVLQLTLLQKTVSTVFCVSKGKPLKRFLSNASVATGLKPGVNEKDF